MKKILTVLLIAVMAAGFVFAGVSGAAELDFGYNFETKAFGFDASNTEVNFDIDLGSSVAAAGEGDVHAEVEAKAKLQFTNDTFSSKKADDYTIEAALVDGSLINLDTSWAAKIVGANWSVALKTAKFAYNDFASSAIDTFKDGKKNAVGSKYIGFTKTALSIDDCFCNSDYVGVEATVYDYKLGLVFDGNKKTTVTDFKAYVATRDYEVDGFSAKLGGSVVYAKADANTSTQVGLSAKFGYAADKFAGSVASDVEITKGADKAQFEIATAAKYDFVSFDGYYVNDVTKQEYNKYGDTIKDSENEDKVTKWENYMSAKLAFDFAKFDVPVTFTVTGKNLLAIFNSTTATNTQLAFGTGTDFKFEVAYTGLIDASAYFEINTKDCYSLGLAASYDAAMFTVGAGFDYAYQLDKSFEGVTDKRFMPTVYVTTDKLVPGAVLSLGWYSNTSATKSNKSNILSGSKDMGNITAKCVIAF